METAALRPDKATRLEHLAIANDIRSRRAVVRRQLAAGELELVDAIVHPALGSARILDVLCWCPRVGRVKALKMLRAADVGPARRCREITLRQRHLLTLPAVHTTAQGAPIDEPPAPAPGQLELV